MRTKRDQTMKMFSCPICNILLCSRGNLKHAPSAASHFKREHPHFDTKTHCMSCMSPGVTPEHKLNCLKQCSALRNIKPIAPQPWGPMVRKKTFASPYATGWNNDPEYREPADARLVRDVRMRTTREPTFGDRSHVGRAVCPKMDPRPSCDTPAFGEYLKRTFDAADPSTALGKAIRTLISYEDGKYYHLIVCYEHLKTFLRLMDEEIVQATDFYCFCNSMDPVKDKSVRKALHLHLLAYVPDWSEFNRNVWRRLPPRTGIRYKTAKKIQDLFHHFNVILYTSQQKPCGKRRSEGEVLTVKHFAMNVRLDRDDRIKLLLAIPAIASHVLGRFNQMRHLQHFDIHHVRKDAYHSELKDMIRHIDVFGREVAAGICFDARNQRVVAFEDRTTAGEVMLITFGDDAKIVWTYKAKEYCKTLFHVIVADVHEKTRSISVSLDSRGRLWISDAGIGPAAVTDSRILSDVIAGIVRRGENVRLIGHARAVTETKRFLGGWDADDGSIQIAWENWLIRVFYTLTDDI